jgi:hypothetical protein
MLLVEFLSAVAKGIISVIYINLVASLLLQELQPLLTNKSWHMSYGTSHCNSELTEYDLPLG